MSEALLVSTASMGTVVTIHVVARGASDDQATRQAAADRALAWFHEVERVCSRFDPESELSRLCRASGDAVQVSELLFETLRFAVAVADETDGAFDPTVGAALEGAGFDRAYRDDVVVQSAPRGSGDVSYRDIEIDAHTRSVKLRRPMLLDLGAVAKGLAIDMAARQLRDDGYENFAIDAGGDLYFAGARADGAPWTVGIRHPRREGEITETVRATNVAVCTSGDYERRVSGANSAIEHHIVDPRTGGSAAACASVTTLASSATVADALGTAAFVLGPSDGLALLERHGVDGVIITPSLERLATPAMREPNRLYRGDQDLRGTARAG